MFLFSSRTCDQLAALASLKSRKAFQQTERHPATHGLSGPLNLTARWRSVKLELCLRVSSHRFL